MPTPALVAQTAGLTVDRVDPWKEDGNVVLAAEGKYFRVHRSILSTHSEVFKDMFDCIHSNEAEKEFIDMCPVIHLHDAATDVQIVLKALYDRSYPLPYYEGMSFSIVAAFLHLGEKYAISALIKEAKARLCCAFQPTLINVTLLTPPFRPKLFPGITDSDPYNFQIMNLLQEMDLKAPLPLAMYQCMTTCPSTDIVDGYQFNGSLCSLSLANLQTFIRMKGVLQKFRLQLSRSLRTSPACTGTSCAYNKRRLWSKGTTIAPPFDSWRSEWDNLFCDSCRGRLAAKRTVVVNKTWDQIPPAFGFNSWEEVKKSGDFPSLTIYTH